MSMAQTRNTFSHKTFAIAIASAVAMGGIAIPQAGAVAGYTGYLYAPDEAAIKDWQDAHPNATEEEFKNYLLDEAPITSYQHKITGSTWDVIRYDHTYASYGYATDLNTANGRIDGLIISSVPGSETPVPGSENAPSYGTAHALKNVQQDFNPENTRPLSLDSKRVLYTITRLGQESIDGISPEVKSELAAAGYDIDSAKSALAGFRNNNQFYRDNRLDASLKQLTEQDIQDGVRKKNDAFPTGMSNIYPASTLTDYLFTVLSLAGAAAWSSDSDYNGTDKPAMMEKIRSVGEYYVSVYNNEALAKDTVKFIDALIAISSKVTEEDINNSDVPMYWVESPDNPGAKFMYNPAIDVVNAKFNTNTPEDTAPAEDIYVTEVRDNGDGTYTLIRNDGSKVPGNIDTSGSITNIKTDGKGNLVITINGKDKVVPLDQVKVTESNKGTPEHTVTITTPDGKSVTFNVFDTYVTDIKWNKEKGLYEIYRSDVDGGKTVWKTIDLSDLRNRIDALEKKESPSKADFDNLKKQVDDLKKQVDDLKAADKKLEGDITNLKTEINNLDSRITKIEARLTKVEGDTAALTKCVSGAGMAGIPTLLSIPLMIMTQLNIPGIKDLNTQVQKQIGMYNPDLARAWERNGGILQAGAVLAGLAGMIGSITYIAKQCDPMMKTPAAQESDLGQLSSKVEKAKAKAEAGSSKKTEAEKQAEAPSESAVEAEANADAEAATAPSEELVDAQ